MCCAIFARRQPLATRMSSCGFADADERKLGGDEKPVQQHQR